MSQTTTPNEPSVPPHPDSTESAGTSVQDTEETVPAEVADQTTTGKAARPRVGLHAWLGNTVSTSLAVLMLGGLGYWGHHSDWKIPKFSELSGNGPAEQPAWCEEHGVPDALCIACNADLMPKGKLHGWCREHGVAECVLEHTELAQLKETPVVLQEDLDRARRALALLPRVKNDPTCKLHLRRIQFPSISVVDKAGIDIGLVERGAIVESVSVTGEIVYDPTRVARLSSRASGTVWRVEKNIGDTVQQGDVLALVDAAEVGRAKADLLQAVAQLDLRNKTYDRLAGLGGVVPARRVLEAETSRAEAEVAVEKAIQSLVNMAMPITYKDATQTPAKVLKGKVHVLGLPTDISQDLDPARTTSNLLPILAPRHGIVVTRDVVAGEVVDVSRTLFTVVDTSGMWLMLNVPLEKARYIAVGQKVLFRPDGLEHRDEGTITWISTDVDTQTRTVRVRAELSNDDGHLRNETFGAGEIVLREEASAIVVPTHAVHWEGCCHVVFVRDKNFLRKGSFKVFHTRMVRPGVTNGDQTEVLAGLFPGEVVVTKGSGILRSELLKGNLGAG